MNETNPTKKMITVSDIVRRDYRAADIFKKWGINYCCGGNVSLAEACALKDLSPDAVQHDLDTLKSSLMTPEVLAANEWPVDFLIDYIVHVHHAYLKRVLPAVHNQLHTFVSGHLKKYPYLQEVEDVFVDLAAELVEHNQHEEESIFPYLKQIVSTHKRKEVYGSLFVRTLGRPLDQKVLADHKRIAALLSQLRIATNYYHFEDEACTNHQVIYHKLQELDNNLAMHKYLENNILYPKVMQMEQELVQVT